MEATIEERKANRKWNKLMDQHDCRIELAAKTQLSDLLALDEEFNQEAKRVLEQKPTRRDQLARLIQNREAYRVSVEKHLASGGDGKERIVEYFRDPKCDAGQVVSIGDGYVFQRLSSSSGKIFERNKRNGWKMPGLFQGTGLCPYKGLGEMVYEQKSHILFFGDKGTTETKYRERTIAALDYIDEGPRDFSELSDIIDALWLCSDEARTLCHGLKCGDGVNSGWIDRFRKVARLHGKLLAGVDALRANPTDPLRFLTECLLQNAETILPGPAYVKGALSGQIPIKSPEYERLLSIIIIEP